MFPPHVAAVGCSVSSLTPCWMFCGIVFLRAKLRLFVDSNFRFSTLTKLLLKHHLPYMSMQLSEPVSILFPIHVSFLLEALLHFLFGHFLGPLHFPLSTFHWPRTCLFGIWFCLHMDRGSVSPTPWRKCSTFHSGTPQTFATLHWLEVCLGGTWFCSVKAKDYWNSCPTSRLGSSARWQRLVIASALALMLGS